MLSLISTQLDSLMKLDVLGHALGPDLGPIREANTPAIAAVAILAVVLIVVVVLARRRSTPDTPALPDADRGQPDHSLKTPDVKPKAATAAELATDDVHAPIPEAPPEPEKAEVPDEDSDAEKARALEEEERRKEGARLAEARDLAAKEAAEEAKRLAREEARAEEERKAEARRRKEEEKQAQKAKEAAAKAKKAEEARKAKEAKKAEEAAPATLRDGLGRTKREGFIARLSGLFSGKKITDDLLDEVEETLFTADIGVRTADRLMEKVRDALSRSELRDGDKVWEVLKNEAEAILSEAHANAQDTTPPKGTPKVTMVLGVNGVGKTTSIGKLAHKLISEGKKVTLVAGDTFRAAATEQLEHWANRVGAQCVKGKEGADPASVVFDGVKQAVEEGVDHVLVDTAGRLHSNKNLMEELKKVRRVMGRAIEGAPHEVLMVLDATTGQNGISQAKIFGEATDVTGIVLTKLDGTAKGGVVLGICDEVKIPIKWIGIGERVADLRPFDAKDFVNELFSQD